MVDRNELEIIVPSTIFDILFILTNTRVCGTEQGHYRSILYMVPVLATVLHFRPYGGPTHHPSTTDPCRYDPFGEYRSVVGVGISVGDARVGGPSSPVDCLRPFLRCTCESGVHVS